jgi:hypothetical protein
VVVDRLYELAQDTERPELRETLQVGRREWDSLEPAEQHRILTALFMRIGYDHRRRKVSLQLANNGGQAEAIEVSIQRSLFARPPAENPCSTIAAGLSSRQPKVSRLIALALRFEAMLQDGTVKNHAEVARWGGVTRSRISQILNLRNLAPAIQEQLLLDTASSANHITEHTLQSLTRELDWRKQIARFAELKQRKNGSSPVTMAPASPRHSGPVPASCET